MRLIPFAIPLSKTVSRDSIALFSIVNREHLAINLVCRTLIHAGPSPLPSFVNSTMFVGLFLLWLGSYSSLTAGASSGQGQIHCCYRSTAHSVIVHSSQPPGLSCSPWLLVSWRGSQAVRWCLPSLLTALLFRVCGGALSRAPSQGSWVPVRVPPGLRPPWLAGVCLSLPGSVLLCSCSSRQGHPAFAFMVSHMTSH